MNDNTRIRLTYRHLIDQYPKLADVEEAARLLRGKIISTQVVYRPFKDEEKREQQETTLEVVFEIDNFTADVEIFK
jgi:hypothetical protein